MSSYDETMYHPSPASSSELIESAAGTPHTSLSAFSPEDARIMKSSTVHLGVTSSRSSQQDPFVSTGTQPRGGLSAKATAFEPSADIRTASATTSAFTMDTSQKTQIPNASDCLENFAVSRSPNRAPHQTNATHFGTFTTDSHSTRVIKVTGKNPVATFLPFIEASKKKLRDRGMGKRGSERPEEMGNSYFLRLANIKDSTELYAGIKMDNPGLVVDFVSPVTFGQLFSPVRYSAHEGQVLLTVDYPPDSNPDKKLLESSLIQMLEVEGKLHAWQKLSATPSGTFRMFAEYEDASCASSAVTRSRKINDNLKLRNVTVSVDLHRPDLVEPIQSQQVCPPATPTRHSGERSGLNDTLGNMSLNTPSRSPDSTGTTSVSTRPNASSMPCTASGFPMTNTLPFVVGGLGSVYVPSVVNSFQRAYAPGVHSQTNLGQVETRFHSFTPHAYPQDGFLQQGFGSSTNLRQSQFGNEFGYYNQGLQVQSRDLEHYDRRTGRRPFIPKAQHARGRQHPNTAHSHHNHVDIAKIRQGIDVRTTVMLRNIPNKVDQAMLKEIVDESSFGRYDFMYLRIDFSNNCNVGYAFINFTDPLDIIDFVVARSNQKWHRFKSDKVAEVSYATIQGKDCLVQKFRNSSVMLEPPHYRPKLFKTIHDQFGGAGEEERFPDSDNASKLKRSCENAEHVGLFAPSAGQHLRDEQRRRRSQYDRGTSLAEREEYGYDDPVYHQFGFPQY